MGTQDIKDIFTILHDGSIERIEFLNDGIRLMIEIEYIAELINSDYKFIYLTLHNVQRFAFDPWAESNPLIEDLKRISDLQLAVISTDLDGDQLIVHCSSACNDSLDFEGGRVIIKCKGYSLTDESRKGLTLEQMKALSELYWNNHLGRE